MFASAMRAHHRHHLPLSWYILRLTAPLRSHVGSRIGFEGARSTEASGHGDREARAMVLSRVSNVIFLQGLSGFS